MIEAWSANASGSSGDLPLGTDWQAVGLLLAILACLLLGYTLLLRSPRERIAAHLGGPLRPLVSIRSFIFQRVQVSIGFLLLVLGFAAQLAGHFRPIPPEQREFPLSWAGAIAVLLVLLEVLGWWFARSQLQRSVRQHLLEFAVSLDSDSKLAREVGELFGVEAAPEDTVLQYAQRVRERVGLPPPRSAPGRRAELSPAAAVETGFEEESLEALEQDLRSERRAPS